jgi:serine/threonine protein kinase
MKPEELQSEVKSIKQEIQMLRELSHPNIVKYYGSELSEDG